MKVQENEEASCKSAFQSARSIRADELATYQKDESPRLGVQGAMWGREAKMSFGILDGGSGTSLAELSHAGLGGLSSRNGTEEGALQRSPEDEAEEEPSEAALGAWPLAWPDANGMDRPLGLDEEWVDLTEVFDQAVSDMTLGEMVESQSFRLFDAMSAIEIMERAGATALNADPKMDTGYKSSEDMTMEKAEALGLVSAEMEPELMVGLMDRLLMYYLLWLDGHTIVQTCYSCLYLQDPPRLLTLGQRMAKAFFPRPLGVAHVAASGGRGRRRRRPVWFGRSISSDRLPREDFMPTMFNVDFQLCVFSSDAVKVNEKLKTEKERQENAAVALRLDFISKYMSALVLVAKPKASTLPTAKGLLAKCRQLLEKIKASDPALEAMTSEPVRRVDWKVDGFMDIRGEGGGFLRERLLEALLAHEFPPEANQHCKKQTEPYLQRCTRRFRRLAHIFVDFNELQHEAWRLDETLKSTFGANLRYQRPSWGFIMDQALQVMIQKLLLGFQLDIYEEAELHMIYWYVDYLLGLRVFYLNEIYCAKENSGGKKKPNTRPNKGQKPRVSPLKLLLIDAMQSMVRGLFRLLAFCLSQNLLSGPKAVQTGLCQRFILRFRSLEMLGWT
eukprot:g26790.t1